MSNPSTKIVLSCGYGGCCPTAELQDDGTLEIVDADVVPPQKITLKPAQAKQVAALVIANQAKS